MKNIIKFWSIFASILIVIAIIIACADGDYDEDSAKTSFFTQHTMLETKADESYKPFFRLLSEPFYGSSREDLSTNQMIDFWYDYFNKQVSKEEINNLLFNTALTSIDHLIFYIKDNNYSKIPQSLKTYAINSFADKSKSTAFLYYLGFAKRCEVYSVSYEASWEDNPNVKSVTLKNLQELINGGLNAIKNPKSAAIQERYQFQLVRLYFHKAQQFDSNFDEAIQYFESIKNQFSIDPLMKYRAMGYAAAAYYKKGDYSNANYLYALIYDQCPSMKVVAQFSFHPLEEADFAISLKKATNIREQCVLWHLLGLYADESRAIEQIYALDPKSDLLNLLLVRHVSIIEEQALPNNNWFDKSTDPEIAHLDSLYRFMPQRINKESLALVKKIADAGNTQRPYLWSMAYGYLATIKNDTAIANQYFEKAKNQNTGNTNVIDQIRICKLLLKANNLIRITPAVEEQFYTEFLFIDKLNEDIFYKDDIKKFIFKRLAEQYVRQYEVEKAMLCQKYFIKEFYYDTKNLDRMISFLSKPTFSNYEQYLKNHYEYTLNDFYETEGIRLAYDGKLDASIAKLSNGQAGSTELLGNPFNIHINDCHDCDHEAAQKRKFSKLQFVQEMKKIETIATTTNSSTDYFLLANAYYNMSYFGNARLFYTTNITDDQLYGTYFFPLNSEWNKPNDRDMYIFDCSKAEKYYLLAAANTTDKEMKAKCMFMAAKCEQNNFYITMPSDYKGDFKSGKYFTSLWNEYKNTNYYKEVLKECTYFQTYVDSKR